MHGKSVIVLSIAALFVCQAEVPGPPTTERVPVVDRYHGIEVTDPYRWLENNNDPSVLKWIEAQNSWARSQLDHLAWRPKMVKRVAELMNANSTPVYTANNWVK